MAVRPTMKPATPKATPPPRDMEAMGFGVVDESAVDYSLLVCSCGLEKNGKSWWAFNAPGPIAAISSDTGTEAVAKEWRRKDKEIMLYSYRVPKGAARTKEQYEEEWKKLENALYAILDNHKNFRTAVIDTGTEIWEMMRLAEFGKLAQVNPYNYGPVNQKFRSLVKEYYDTPGLNSIWVHKMRKEYKATKDGKDAWSGEFERAGNSDMPFLADLILTNFYDRESQQFGVYVNDSRYSKEMLCDQTFYGEESTFATLAMYSFPETDMDYWL